MSGNPYTLFTDNKHHPEIRRACFCGQVPENMATYQPVGVLPPLSAVAAITHKPGAVSSLDTAGTSSTGSSTANEYRDARIKDPIPKKLKGQTSSLSGKFGVLQMEVGRHGSPLERDKLAKQASESTELAAMKAYKSGHGVSSIKRFVRVPDNSNAWDSSHTISAVARAHSPTMSSSATAQPLTPTDVKKEQARLLALLRDLSASSVKDQICKALVYFGGVPGAAPPSDSNFPMSEFSNGSGAAFVGWIAEIFPKLSGNSTAADKAAESPPPLAYGNSDKVHAAESGALPAPPVTTAVSVFAAGVTDGVDSSTGKRRRGRPKGSKASKARCDKGIKKGPIKDRKVSAMRDTASNSYLLLKHQEPQLSHSWLGDEQRRIVDVTDTINDDFSPADSNACPGTGGAEPELEQQASVPRMDSFNLGDTGPPTSVQPAEPRKKRGRPKGSKNRSKSLLEGVSDILAGTIGATNVTPKPLPVVPVVPNVVEPPKKPRKKKKTGPTTHSIATDGTDLPSTTDHSHIRDHRALHIQEGSRLPNVAAGAQHPPVPLTATVSSASAGNKRKRTKTQKPENTPVNSISRRSSMGGTAIPSIAKASYDGQPSDYVHGVLALPNEQRLTETTNSALSSVNGSASPGSGIINRSTAAEFAQTEEASGIDESIMPSLDPNGSSHGVFTTAAAFDVFSSHLNPETAASLTGQQQHNHDHDLASLLNQHLTHQHRQSLQQQPLVVQKSTSLTPPYRGSEQFGTTQHQVQEQAQRQQVSQGPSDHNLQQNQAHQQVSLHGSSSVSSHHNAPTQVTTSLSSSFLGSQQLPRPNVSQPFYAQKRQSGSDHFGQLISQPLHQQNQQRQRQQKLQYASQYQAQGQYSSHSQQQQQQQQPFVPDQRDLSQNVNSSTSGLLNQTGSHRSPQFAAPNTNPIRPVTGTFIADTPGGSMTYSPLAYDQNRRQHTTGSPGLGHTYGTSPSTSYALGQSGQPSFMSSRPQHSPSGPHSQSVGNVGQGLQSFHGLDSPSLFDGISLDTAGSSNSLGLTSAATYGLGGLPRTSNGANAFGSTSGALDANLGSNMRDRFYSVRR